MNKKYILILALTIIVLLTACGNTETSSEGTNTNADTSYNAEYSEEKTEISETEQTEEITEDEYYDFDEDEPEDEGNNPLYDYYNLLNEEYNKIEKKYYAVDSSFGEYLYIKEGNMLYFGKSYDKENMDYNWYSYDMDTKTLEILFNSDKIGDKARCMGYSDGSFYFFIGQDPDVKLIKTDKYGVLLKEFEHKMPTYYFTSAFLFDGPKLCAYVDEQNEYVPHNIVMSPDFEILTEMSSYVFVSFSYNNNLYSFDVSENNVTTITKFDLNANEWNNTGIEIENNLIETIGKYCVTFGGIVDIETGEYITENMKFNDYYSLGQFFYSYCGGKYNYIFDKKTANGVK